MTVALSHRAACLVLCVSASVLACSAGSGSDAGVDVSVVDAPWRFAPATCAAAEQAPIRDDAGRSTCVSVGARAASSTDEFADTTSSRPVVMFVRPGATGGDGSRARPYGTIVEAVAAPGVGTIALARGRHRLASALTLTSSLEFVGAGTGASDTVVDVAADTIAFGASGASADVTLASFRIVISAGAMTTRAAAVDVTMGASVTLRDVAIDGTFDGIRVDAARLRADFVTVMRTRNRAVMLRNGADAALGTMLIRDGLAYGVDALDSHLVFDTGLVMENGREGGVVRGGRAGVTDRISRVSFLCNAIAGLRVEGSPSGNRADVEGRRLALSGTRALASEPGGDGLYVGPGATFRLDADLASAAARGTGSEIVGNARAGALVAGDPAGRVSAPDVTLDAATISSNRMTGVFLQNRARATALAFLTLQDNGALGVGATSGAQIASLVGNVIEGTRAAVLRGMLADVTVGDAISMSDGTGTATITDNNLSGSARFAVILAGQNAVLRGNTGRDNEFGVGGYSGVIDVDSSNRIDARSTSPTVEPAVVRGGLGAVN